MIMMKRRIIMNKTTLTKTGKRKKKIKRDECLADSQQPSVKCNERIRHN